MSLISIVIPSKESRKIVSEFIGGNLEILKQYPLIVINTEGGEGMLRFPCKNYLHVNVTMAMARRIGYNHVNTPYTLNLDIDTILPDQFIEDALNILAFCKEVAVVALDYDKLQGHLAFGASLWRSNALRKLYDFQSVKTNICECAYMWGKVVHAGMAIETLPYRAIHLKEGKS
jgi:hypothetical protein